MHLLSSYYFNFSIVSISFSILKFFSCSSLFLFNLIVCMYMCYRTSLCIRNCTIFLDLIALVFLYYSTLLCSAVQNWKPQRNDSAMPKRVYCSRICSVTSQWTRIVMESIRTQCLPHSKQRVGKRGRRVRTMDATFLGRTSRGRPRSEVPTVSRWIGAVAAIRYPRK